MTTPDPPPRVPYNTSTMSSLLTTRKNLIHWKNKKMVPAKLKGFIAVNGTTLDEGKPVPVAARSKTWVCGRSSAEIVGSNPARGIEVCLL